MLISLWLNDSTGISVAQPTNNKRNNETADKLKELNDLQAELRDNMNAQIANYNSQVNSGNDQSTQVTNNYGGGSGGEGPMDDAAALAGL